MAAGLVTTIASCFPALVMKLLEFIALYGLILMPMGVVVLADFWVLPRIGLKSNFAELSKHDFNWAPGAAWGITIILALLAVRYFQIEIFFVGLPG